MRARAVCGCKLLLSSKACALSGRPPDRRRSERLRSACSMYALQNFSLAASAAALLAASLAPRGGGLFWACSTAAIACGAASSLFALGSSLAVEREWPKTLCGADSAALARFNAGAASMFPLWYDQCMQAE